MSTPKLSPQEARRKIIQLMAKMMLARKEWTSVKDFKDLFMFNSGASRTKTDDYFDLCKPRLIGLEFNAEGTEFRIKPTEETKTET